MTVWFRSMAQMNSVAWGKNNLWDIQFPNGPKGFTDWFPAHSITEGYYTVNTHEVQGAYTTAEIPKDSTLFELQVNFFDNVPLDISHWLKDWANTRILKDGLCTNWLSEVVDQVNVLKLDRKRRPLRLSSYWVFPKGELGYVGGSDGSPIDKDVTFVIAGMIPVAY